jgi:outer membrane protein assembly factor BamB
MPCIKDANHLKQSLPMKLGVLVWIFFLHCAKSAGDDRPQFRGPQLDGVSRKTGLLKSWPEDGPKQLWLCTNLGAGYSGPAIVREQLFIMGQRSVAQ